VWCHESPHRFLKSQVASNPISVLGFQPHLVLAGNRIFSTCSAHSPTLLHGLPFGINRSASHARTSRLRSRTESSHFQSLRTLPFTEHSSFPRTHPFPAISAEGCLGILAECFQFSPKPAPARLLSECTVLSSGKISS